MFKKVFFSAVIIGVLLGLNWLISTQIESYAINVILHAGIFVILAVSLNLVNGFTGQFSLGQAGFYGIGAYAAAALTTYGQLTIFKHWFHSDGTISTWLGSVMLICSMLVGGCAAGLAGLLVGLPSLKLRGDYLAIVTLGLNQIFVVILNNLNQVGGPRGFGTIYPSGITPISIPALSSFFWVYLVAAIVIVVSINIRYSIHGLAFIAIREDEVAAEAMGIPTTKYKITAFVLSAFFAGVAGALFTHTDCFIAPTQFDFITSINIVVMVVLGGMGSVSGTAIGALLLSVLPEVLRQGFSEYRLVVYAALLIALMLFRPKGIFGQEELSIAWFKGQMGGIRKLFQPHQRQPNGQNLIAQGNRNYPVDSIELLGLRIDRLTMDEAITSIMGFIESKVPHHVVTADASMVVLAREDPDLQRIVRASDLVTPDGAGILWASRMLNMPVRNKVSGVDLVEKLCSMSSQTGIKLYFLGSGPDVAATAAEKLTKKYPGAKIVGTRNGFFTKDEEADVVKQVAATEPDVVFVAFGIPKQEKFIDRYKGDLKASVYVGVGGSFDVYSGLVKRAPVWMQNAGLEWIFRLWQNPKKISKVMTLPRFAMLAIVAKITGKHN